MNPIMIAGPAVEPITVAEMRAFLRLDDSSEDDLVAELIKTARLWVEAASGRILISQTWRIGLDGWPEERIIRVPLSPLLAVDAIRVFDADGSATILVPEQYRAELACEPPRILIEAAAPEPGRSQNGIEIDVRVGYGDDTSAVPAPLRQSVRMLVARWFEHRGDEHEVTHLPPDMLALVAPFRRPRV